MKALISPRRGAVVEELIQPQRIRATESVLPCWKSPALVRCACSACGTHAHRRFDVEDGGRLRPAKGSAACPVCGANDLVAVDLVDRLLAL